MIVDVHTHAFPDFLAAKAVAILAKNSGEYVPFTDGTVRGLLQSMDNAGIDISFIASIATRPEQARPILEWSRSIASARMIPLGSVHPDSPAWEQEIDAIADAGLIGIKLHPQYQGFVIDDARYLPFYEKLASRQLMLLLHAGYDIAFPKSESALPQRIARLHSHVPSLVIVAAHLGGWQAWDQVCEHLLGLDVYLDTSFIDEVASHLQNQILWRHSRERIVFGSDSPWQAQQQALTSILRLPIDADYKDKILGGNAQRWCRALSQP